MEQSGFHHLCFSFHLFCVFGGFFEQATVSWAQPTRETAPMPPVRRKVRRSSFQVRAFFLVFLFLGGAGCFSMILVAVQHDEGRSAWKCVNR